MQTGCRGVFGVHVPCKLVCRPPFNNLERWLAEARTRKVLVHSASLTLYADSTRDSGLTVYVTLNGSEGAVPLEVIDALVAFDGFTESFLGELLLADDGINLSRVMLSVAVSKDGKLRALQVSRLQKD